jgi:acyl carrier protein
MTPDVHTLKTQGLNRTNSLSATEMIVIIERDFGMNLSDPDLDISQLDMLAQIEAMTIKAKRVGVTARARDST